MADSWLFLDFGVIGQHTDGMKILSHRVRWRQKVSALRPPV